MRCQALEGRRAQKRRSFLPAGLTRCEARPGATKGEGRGGGGASRTARPSGANARGRSECFCLSGLAPSEARTATTKGRGGRGGWRRALPGPRGLAHAGATKFFAGGRVRPASTDQGGGEREGDRGRGFKCRRARYRALVPPCSDAQASQAAIAENMEGF